MIFSQSVGGRTAERGPEFPYPPRTGRNAAFAGALCNHQPSRSTPTQTFDMDQQQLEIALDRDRTAVVLRLPGVDGDTIDARLEAPELDELIRGLSDARARLAEEVSPELDEGARITNTVADPSYVVARNQRKGLALLAFRHPGLGWLGFQLRQSVVEAMLDSLHRGVRGERQGR